MKIKKINKFLMIALVGLLATTPIKADKSSEGDIHTYFPMPKYNFSPPKLPDANSDLDAKLRKLEELKNSGSYSYSGNKTKREISNKDLNSAIRGMLNGTIPLNSATGEFRPTQVDTKACLKEWSNPVKVPNFTQPFGVGNPPHRGLDIVYADNNPAIYAAGPGIVKVVQNYSSFYNKASGKVDTRGICNGGNISWGNMVLIDHGNGIQTRYAHMSKILVRTGQVVASGQQIGIMGHSG